MLTAVPKMLRIQAEVAFGPRGVSAASDVSSRVGFQKSLGKAEEPSRLLGARAGGAECLARVMGGWQCITQAKAALHARTPQRLRRQVLVVKWGLHAGGPSIPEAG
jgi:hypothetical protein